MKFIFELTMTNIDGSKNHMGKFNSLSEAEDFAKRYMRMYSDAVMYSVYKRRVWF